jgi:hypothetical protein
MSEPSDAQLHRLFALYAEIGITDRSVRITHMRRVLDDDGLASASELSEAQASTLIAALEGDPRRMFLSAAEAKMKKRRDFLSALTGRPGA